MMCRRIIIFTFVSSALAYYGDLKISSRQGGPSGTLSRLEFENSQGRWGTVCDFGFDQDAANVACKQLGYRRSSRILDHQFFNLSVDLPINVCLVSCNGDEDRLVDCFLDTDDCNIDDSCKHPNDVGVTCTNSLSTLAIVGISLGAFCVVFGTVAAITCCLCCLHPRCLCYYRKIQRVAPPQNVVHRTTNAAIKQLSSSLSLSYQYHTPPQYKGYQTISPSD